MTVVGVGGESRDKEAVAGGNPEQTGVAPNELTTTDWRDPYAGTPWHKHVPARLEAVT